MFLHVSIRRSSSGSRYCSLLKLQVKIVVSIAGGYVHTPLQWKQRIHKHTICFHITDKYKDIFTILTPNLSKEQYVLPEDDLRIETCRSILSVLM